MPGLRLTAVFFVFFMLVYPLLLLAGAQLAKGKGQGWTIKEHGKVIGWQLLGQPFKQARYFQGRPSAVNYDASGSGASNAGPSNPVYLEEVQKRIDSFLVHNPGIDRRDIPADLVTASGSGLDPDISVEGALVQVKRISAARHIPEYQLKALIKAHIKGPLWGWVGPSCVNVLLLNLDLDNMK